jgi:hypothetical protein
MEFRSPKHMKTKHYFLLCVVALFSLTSEAAIYYGPEYNPDTLSGTAVNGGSLTLNENSGQTGVNLRFTRGLGTFNDILVIYIDSVPNQGFNTTSGFNDQSSIAANAVSGTGTAGRSVANFASGFGADYAIVMGVQNRGISGLYQLANGGDGSLALVRSLVISPLDDNATFGYFDTSFTWANVGLESPANRGFRFESTYILTSGSRELQSFEPLAPGSRSGFRTITFADSHVFGVDPIPEPGTATLAIAGGLFLAAGLVFRRR